MFPCTFECTRFSFSFLDDCFFFLLLLHPPQKQKAKQRTQKLCEVLYFSSIKSALSQFHLEAEKNDCDIKYAACGEETKSRIGGYDTENNYG